MIKGVHHIAISTSDLDEMCRFYCDVLGFEKVRESGWEAGTSLGAVIDEVVGIKNSSAKVAMVAKYGFRVEIFEYKSPAGKPGDPGRRACDHGYTHICFEVEDIDAEFDKLRAAGMVFDAERPPGPFSGQRAVYGKDPEGNAIEIYEILQGPKISSQG